MKLQPPSAENSGAPFHAICVRPASTVWPAAAAALAAEAVAALAAVEQDYGRRCRAARALAAEMFGAQRVLGRLLADAGL